jgi:hypothetical protein
LWVIVSLRMAADLVVRDGGARAGAE